jgi:diguanylate cyclase (GGDEF)-like protein
MTTTSQEDAALAAALAMLWQRHRQANLDLITLIETTTADVLRSEAGHLAVAEAAGAAHKLAGSLGTFGLESGSRAALEAELLLREPTIDGQRLAEAVTALRASVDEVGDASPPTPLDPGKPVGGVVHPSSETIGEGMSVYHVASRDGSLISRLSVEATAAGVAVTSGADPSSPSGEGGRRPSAVIIDDDSTRASIGSELLGTVAELAAESLVVVLTDRDALDDRVELARAGASGVLSRSQNARQVISLVDEALARRRPSPSTIVVLNADAGLEATLRRALPVPGCRLLVRNDPMELWDTLEEQGADLVIAGAEGSPVTGVDLCRAVRGHARWHRLPVLIIGDRSAAPLAEAMDAGADDYLDAKGPVAELTTRIHHQLSVGRLIQTRCDIDPLTKTENRASAERSLDHLLRLATRRKEPMALALLTVDQFDQLREEEGNAMGDVLLRQLGNRLLDTCHDEDVVGRWSHDGFAVGIYGAGSEDACRRMDELLRSFAAEQFQSTSGRMARHTFTTGIASSPTDASTFHSLERLAGSALRRARTGRNHLVLAGERSTETPRHDIDVDVVLVEDDDSFADVVEHALGLRHYSFLRFSDGAEAAAALGGRSVRGRVVLLDIGLPSLDGFGVLKEMRRRGALDDTRVIMLTARSSEAETLRALGLGATEHMTKPLSIPVLLGRLDETRFRSVA